MLLGFAPFVCVALACSVNANVGALEALADASGAGFDAGPGADAQGGTTDASPEADATSTPPIDAGCNVTFPQEASFVDVAVTMGVPPSYEGGAITLGTYRLVAMRVFVAGTTGTMQVRETIVVRGGAKAGAIDRLTEARSATGSFTGYPLHGETSTWEAPSGPFFLQTPECPTKAFQRTGRYQATGGTLALFDDADGIERTYERIR